MDDIRDSFSRMKKKFKYKLTGSKRKPDRTGPDARGEKTGSTGSLPRLEPRVVANGSHDRGGDGANTDGRQAYSTDLGCREVDIGGGGFSQRHSYLHADAETAMENRRSGEVERVYPSTFTPSIPSSGKPGGV